jgi:hypothetical protein
MNPFQPVTRLEQDSILTVSLSELRDADEGAWFAENLGEEYATLFSTTDCDDRY